MTRERQHAIRDGGVGGSEIAESTGPGPVRGVRAAGRPTAVVRLGFLLRGLAVWVAVHLGIAFAVGAGGGSMVSTLTLSPIGVAALLTTVYAAVAIDQRVRREDLLLGNAGIAPWVGPAHAAGAAAVLEVVVRSMATGGLG